MNKKIPRRAYLGLILLIIFLCACVSEPVYLRFPQVNRTIYPHHSYKINTLPEFNASAISFVEFTWGPGNDPDWSTPDYFFFTLQLGICSEQPPSSQTFEYNGEVFVFTPLRPVELRPVGCPLASEIVAADGNNDVSTTQLIPPNYQDTELQWEVSACITDVGCSEAVSRSFTISHNTPPPTLVSPPDEDTPSDLIVEFSWDPGNEHSLVEWFLFCISLQPDADCADHTSTASSGFVQRLNNTQVTDLSLDLHSYANRKIYWNVASCALKDNINNEECSYASEMHALNLPPLPNLSLLPNFNNCPAATQQGTFLSGLDCEIRVSLSEGARQNFTLLTFTSNTNLLINQAGSFLVSLQGNPNRTGIVQGQREAFVEVKGQNPGQPLLTAEIPGEYQPATFRYSIRNPTFDLTISPRNGLKTVWGGSVSYQVQITPEPGFNEAVNVCLRTNDNDHLSSLPINIRPGQMGSITVQTREGLTSLGDHNLVFEAIPESGGMACRGGGAGIGTNPIKIARASLDIFRVPGEFTERLVIMRLGDSSCGGVMVTASPNGTDGQNNTLYSLHVTSSAGEFNVNSARGYVFSPSPDCSYLVTLNPYNPNYPIGSVNIYSLIEEPALGGVFGSQVGNTVGREGTYWFSPDASLLTIVTATPALEFAVVDLAQRGHRVNPNVPTTSMLSINDMFLIESQVVITGTDIGFNQITHTIEGVDFTE